MVRPQKPARRGLQRPCEQPKGGRQLLVERCVRRCYTQDLVQRVSLSSRGLGRRPLTAQTGVRIPVGTPLQTKNASHFLGTFPPNRSAIGSPLKPFGDSLRS